MSYSFDANGNMVSEGASRFFEWDYGDRMRWFEEGTTTAAYLYDAGGNRVKKVVRKSSSLKEVTVYIDGGFEYLYTRTDPAPWTMNGMRFTSWTAGAGWPG